VRLVARELADEELKVHRESTVRRHDIARFQVGADIVPLEVKGSPLADMLNDDVMEALATESEHALGEFVVPSGEIVMPTDAHIVTANKR
jgi:hypothetical protein